MGLRDLIVLLDYMPHVLMLWHVVPTDEEQCWAVACGQTVEGRIYHTVQSVTVQVHFQ